jgi:hypothetical protein
MRKNFTPIPGPNRELAVQRLRQRVRMLAGALLVLAGLIVMADLDLG